MYKNINSKNRIFSLVILMMMFFSLVLPITTTITNNEVNAFTKDSLTFESDGTLTNKDFTEGDGTAAWEKVIDKYKGFIVGISSVATVTFIIFFILNITRVAANAANPTARSQAIMGVVWTGIAAALLGSVTVWFGFFYTSLRGD